MAKFGTMEFSVAFQPTSAFPLDARSYFESYAEASAAALTAKEAGSTESIYYIGETFVVVESGQAQMYVIQPDLTLAPVGGVVDTSAFEDRIDKISEQVGEPADAEAETEATGLHAEIANRYTKTETDNAIAEAIASIDHLDRVIKDSIDDIDLSAEDAEKHIYLVGKTGEDGDGYDEYMVIDGKLERVGDWKVDLDDYVTNDALAELLKGKVDVETGKRLMTTEEGDKLAAMLEIKSVSNELVLGEDGMLSVATIAPEKITGLADLLASGKRLITEDEIGKLAGLILNEDGTVESTSKINISGVIGLEDALAQKVEIEEGKSLVEDSLIEKLGEVEAGAQANVIEGIVLGTQTAEIVNKIITIPAATTEMLGLVKSAGEAENGVAVAEDGTMSVTSLNVDRLVQDESSFMILNGGSAQ